MRSGSIVVSGGCGNGYMGEYMDREDQDHKQLERVCDMGSVWQKERRKATDRIGDDKVICSRPLVAKKNQIK